jgi:hypothetical protein
MAVADTAAEDLDVRTGEQSEGDAVDIDALDFPPGVLAPAEVNKQSPPLYFEDDEKNAIKALNKKIAQRDMPARREQIIRNWEAHLFDRQFQHLLPRQNGGWELPAIGSGYGRGEEEDRSQWEIDIYSSYRKIICAALTREVPGTRFEPSDPDSDRDITAASNSEKVKTKIERDNKMKELQGEAARLLWTDGLSVHLTRYVLDAQAFGYEPEPEGDVPEDEETGEAEHAIGHGSGDDQESDEDSEGASSSAGPEDETEEDEDESEDEGEGASGEEPTKDFEKFDPDWQPRGRELITVAGALHWKLPIKAGCTKEMPWARYSNEVDLSTAKAMFPDIADKLQPSQSGSGSADDGDDLERLARINVMLGVEDNFITEDSTVYDITIQKFWYRPSALMEIQNTEVRKRIMAKCWRGLYVTMAGDNFCEGRNASMDDYIAVTFADAGDGVHRPGLGSPLIAPQKVLNTLAELAYDYFVHGVPMTYMDDEMFDVEAINDQDNIVGGVRPFEAVAGAQIEGVYWFREQPVPFPEQLLAYTQWIMDEVAQLMSGAYPALFGGDASNQGVGDALMQRDQALGRLGLPWRNIKETTAAVERQAVQSISLNSEGIIKLGGVEKIQVDTADLRGNILCFPDTDENIPESWTQKSNRFAMIITDAATNPFFQSLLDDPANLKLVKDMSGFKELNIPMLVSWEQQLGEIAILSETGPAPNPAYVQLEQQIAELTAQIKAAAVQPPIAGGIPSVEGLPAPPPVAPPAPDPQLVAQLAQLTQQLQTMPPEISTYPIDIDNDDHDVHALTCLGLINSAKGRAMKNGTAKDQKAFANIVLHKKEHTTAAAAKKAAAQADAAAGPQKPVALSANAKDLPPKEAAAVLQKAGIQSDPKDFAAQDTAEAVAKHPAVLAGAAAAAPPAAAGG